MKIASSKSHPTACSNLLKVLQPFRESKLGEIQLEPFCTFPGTDLSFFFLDLPTRQDHKTERPTFIPEISSLSDP